MSVNTPRRDVTQQPTILQPESVSSPSLEYMKMQEDWLLGIDLWGGTKAMRKRSTRWLPQEEGESDKAYNARLNKTFLYNGYKSTIQRLAGQVFYQPVQVENVPPELEYLEHDFDSEGHSITEVAHQLLEKMLRFGKTHGIMDYPSGTSDLSHWEEKELKIRPYFTEVDPRDLIAWRHKTIGGFQQLEQIRVQEFSIEPYNEFQEIETYRVRVFYPDRVDVHVLRVNDGEESYELEDSIPFTLGEIPLTTAYAAKTGFLVAEPPLNDLAWLNLRHWQSTSDQNTILHVARVPIFFAKGFREGELQATTLGAYKGISTTNQDASLEYIEHTGRAIGAGENDLEKLKKEMHEIGADLLVSRSVDRQTASARSIDRAESLSMLQTMVLSLTRMLENCYELAGKWIGVDASGVSVTIGSEFSVPVSANPVDDLKALGLSDEDMLKEAKRRGILDQSVENISPKKKETSPQQGVQSEEEQLEGTD